MKPFSLLVKPACADCNLRCTYCFYLDRCTLYPDSVRHRMPEEVLERMIQSFMSTDQRQYEFGWQGGEPTLMGLGFFRRVTDLQQKHGRPGSVVANALQTNATLLTNEFAEHLAQYRFLVGVSLDGPASIHDANRKTKSGGGTHALVMRGIERLRRHDVPLNVLTLVSRSNVEKPAQIYRYLRFCAGDCPKNRPGRGSDPRRLSALCEGWKMFYRHALPGLERLTEEVRAQKSSWRLDPRPRVSARGARVPRAHRNDPCPCGSGRKYKRCCGA